MGRFIGATVGGGVTDTCGWFTVEGWINWVWVWICCCVVCVVCKTAKQTDPL